ncbi:hypothetical protein NMG60_11008562 [Bertholletia excelsa]
MLNRLMTLACKRRPNPQASLPEHEGCLTEDTSSSSAQPSPTVNLTCEYTLALQTNSYNEIWTRIHDNGSTHEVLYHGEGEALNEEQRLGQILYPSQECIQEALQHVKSNTLTRLVSAYFDHSERTCYLCLLLNESVRRARLLYGDLHSLLDVLPLDSHSNSLNESQCDKAFDVFLQFDRFDNPFPCPDSCNFHDMQCCFTQLNQQLQHRLSKSRSRIHLLRRATTCSAVCLIGTVIGVIISAVVIASHVLTALVAGPLVPALRPSNITNKEKAHLTQLDSAARFTYVLHKDLETIDRLVERLYDAVDDDKLLIRLGLERGKDRHPIHEEIHHH